MVNFLKSLKLICLIFLKLVRKRFKRIAVFSVILILATYFSIKFGLVSQESGYLSEGFIGTYKEEDLPDFVLKLISSPLLTLDESGKPKSYLVTGWEVNSDATIFKFKLKDNLKWSDQTPVKASDLEFNIPDAKVSFPDEKTIQFELFSSFSPFPTLLTKPIFKKSTTLLGIGPYKISKIEKSRIFITKIVLEKVEANKKLPKIIARFYPNEKTAQTAFALGEIQVLFGPNDSHTLASYSKVRVKQNISYSKIVAIFYNTQDPILSSRSLRQALSFQAPEIQGEALASNPFPLTSWAYIAPQKDYLGNIDKAKAALERAKSNVNEELLKKEIVLTTTPLLEPLGKQIINAWQELGLKVVLRVESGIPQNFQALLIIQTIPADPDQYALWHSTQTKTNISRYDSKRADKDLEDARKTLDEAERKEKYADFQSILSEDAPATFLYFPKYNVIYLQKAENLLNKVLHLQL